MEVKGFDMMYGFVVEYTKDKYTNVNLKTLRFDYFYTENSMTNAERSGSFYAKNCDIDASEENVIDSFKWVKDTSVSMNMLINNAGVAYI